MSPYETTAHIQQLSESVDEPLRFRLRQVASCLAWALQQKAAGRNTEAKSRASTVVKTADELSRLFQDERRIGEALKSAARISEEVLKTADTGELAVPPYRERYPVGSPVQVISLADLTNFMRGYRLHHFVVADQLRYAGLRTTVRAVGFYHGGDVVYTLADAGSYGWLEPCLRDTQT